MATDDKKLTRIKGRIIDRKTKAGLAGLRVEARDKALILKEPFSTTVTDQQGLFLIEFKQGHLRDLFGERQALLFFKVFRDRKLVASTEDSIVWSLASSDKEVVIQVEPSEAPGDNPSKPLSVHGTVRRSDGSPIGEAIVRASIAISDKEDMLGEATTDTAGNYGIASEVEQSLTQPDARLQLRVFDKKGTLLAISSSPIKERDITMDIVVKTPPDEKCVVLGQIRRADHKPLDSGTVRIFGVVPGPEMFLGQQTITVVDEGRYRIEYRSGRFSPRLSDATRVVVRVFDAQDRPLSPTSPLFRANSKEVIDITLSGTVETSIFVVRGQITRRDGGKFSNGIVRAFDADLVNGTLLGETRSGEVGNYLISYKIPPHHPTASTNPNLIIGAYDDRLDLLGKSDIRKNAGPDETINFEIPGEQPIDPGPVPVGAYTVEGSVSSSDRAGVGGLRVRIVDKNVGSDLLLAETATDNRGDYNVSFHVPSLAERCKRQPDLQALVYSGKTFLAASVVRYYAKTREILDVTLPADSAALPSEHETLVGTLAAHCAGILAELQETDDRQDITYLANKTGWDARAVALAALADQFSRRASNDGSPADLPPSLFYALFRAGLPANEDTLYQIDPKTLTAVWNQAAKQGVIPKSVTEMIPRAIEQFQTLSAQKLLTAPALAGTSSLTQMLTASQLTSDQQTRFAALYTEHRTDMPAFWEAVTHEFGDDTSKRLQLDGKLGFLTINNASLTEAIHKLPGGISDPSQLAQQGYHKASEWTELLTSSVPIPKGIPGENPEAKRANYAEYLAAQVRLSYPTASIAQMVKSGDLKLPGATQGTVDRVHSFLSEHQGRFEIGIQPVEQYLARNGLQESPETINQVTRLQRVYQITPGDQAMTGLFNRGIDSAYQIARFEKEEFVKNFKEDLGGSDIAALIYDKSTQVHNAVLNIAISYLTAKNGIGLGMRPLNSPQQNGSEPGLVIKPAPQGPTGDNAADVIAYPTLEGLFGEMDFCACDHCRSVLSPAAYLVDLLQFIDQPNPPVGTENPQTVLFSRRPDIQHLPLTCENTNTALPYIDVVNETLEYFIANNVQTLTLNGYVGHDTSDSESADLLASPQFVMDSAYTTLKSEFFPTPLPFHQPLENLRRYFEKFEVTLPLAMQRFRKSDDLERGANPYGWRDIWMEELRLSRAEHEILTDSATVPLWRISGFPNGTTDANVIIALSNAKQFSRRVGITYEDTAAILQARFVNPNSDLIPKLERLGVPFATLKALKDGTITDAAFDALLPTGATAPDPAAYGGDIKAWVKDNANFARIMSLITLTDPTGNPDPCNFDHLEFRFSNPMANPSDTSTRLGGVEFFRLLRFIRLWKKMGWTIEQTDAAICALYRADLQSMGADDVDSLAELDQGFRTLLPRLGIVVATMKMLSLTPKRDLLSLLACWSDIGTHGNGALYRQMFLNPTMLKQDVAFADNGFGEFLVDGTKRVAQHAEALRSAFNLTGDEFDGIIAALAYDANTALSLSNISAIYRRGYLARKMKISVRELLLLTTLTGLDPFAAPDPTDPAILRLIALVKNLKARSLKSAVALYLIWNQDLSGKSAPASAKVTELARTLRGDFVGIEDQFAATEDPGGDIARARMTLVYGAEASDSFFALLDDTLILDVAYTHGASTLEATITAADPNLFYDDFKHRLSHSGLMTAAMQAALNVAGASQDFKDAVNALFVRGEDIKGAFFARNPELKPLYDDVLALDLTLVLDVDYTHSAAALEPEITAADSRIAYNSVGHRLSYSGILRAAARDRLKSVPNVTPLFKNAVDALFAQSQEAKGAVLAALQPELAGRRKRQQAIQRLSAEGGIDLISTQALLDPASNSYPLHAAGDANQPVLDDVLALETAGLAAQFFFRDTATGAVDLSVDAAANLDYAAAGNNPLPANPTPGADVSGIWTGQVETPEAGFYNFIIEADAGATVTLSLDGTVRPLTQNGNLHRNTQSLELKAGTLYDIELKVEKVKNQLSVKWETPKRPREVIPSRYLYPPTIIAPFTDAYVRFLKSASLAVGLDLTANEIAHFATHSDYHITGDGWLNALPASGDPSAAVAEALLKPFQDLLDYARIKAETSPDDEKLLAALKNPVEATATTNSSLFAMTQWDSASLSDLLSHFGGGIAGLTHFDLFRRVYDAFALIKTMGIPADALIRATTNEPIGETVRDFQAALRARYDNAAWRDVVQPINDAMRALQRDALVSHILHQMLGNPDTEHINTPDKLFEYFLMDVQMEPCMQTSRIRHALSSAQLFIERCLMNLEPRVSPASLVAKQWEWMKRYRVWEANRKVFLYPENWAEPELRDDQSPFFKETMSELLQGDITEEKAAIALLNYLSKLEEVAKLEPCGIHYVENNPGADDDIAHVVARTSGASRKYFYRRREFGYWTPWEQIKLDIEDNPVLPVVWNGRLFLFWLRIMKQAPVDPSATPTSSSTSGPVSNLSMTDVKNDAKTSAQNNLKVTVQAVLCWSEFFNGKWQPTRTSNTDRPLGLGSFAPVGTGAFDRSKLLLSVFFWTKGTIRIIVSTDVGAGASFFLYNPFSSPELRTEKKKNRHFAPKRIMETTTSSLRITYPLTSVNHPVLINEVTDQTIDPHHPVSGNPWDVPFLYEDNRHAFYVTTAQQIVRVRAWSDFGIVTKTPAVEYEIPPLVLQRPKAIPPIGPLTRQPGFGIPNPSPMEFVISEDAYINRGIGTLGTVRFGEKEIGPAGSMAVAIQKR